MSSWLDTKKFINSLAKTAMAEAQKTIDKALDIDEVSLSTNSDSSEIQQLPVMDQWGSFSGSFFTVPPKTSKSKFFDYEIERFLLQWRYQICISFKKCKYINT